MSNNLNTANTTNTERCEFIENIMGLTSSIASKVSFIKQENKDTDNTKQPAPTSQSLTVSTPQTGINIAPYVVGNQQPISGVQEIDNAIDLLAHPNMVAQMEAIAYNVFTGLAKKAPDENNNHTLSEMQNNVNAALGMLKDPAQITVLKQAAGVMLSGDPKETKTIDSPFVDLVSQMLGNKCTCGHDHCTPNA